MQFLKVGGMVEAGPNMAGKSTVLRSVCAVALLTMCGLHAPVARARLPFTDALMLRNFSADSPLENKSSFAVEMVEMRWPPPPRPPLCPSTLSEQEGSLSKERAHIIPVPKGEDGGNCVYSLKH